MQNDQKPVEVGVTDAQHSAPSAATPPRALSGAEQQAYYDRLRKGTQQFDPLTANALLMKVNIEAQEHDRQLLQERKPISLLSALAFPWRLFDPKYAPSSSTKIAVIVVIFVVLTGLGFLVPSLLRFHK